MRILVNGVSMLRCPTGYNEKQIKRDSQMIQGFAFYIGKTEKV